MTFIRQVEALVYVNSFLAQLDHNHTGEKAAQRVALMQVVTHGIKTLQFVTETLSNFPSIVSLPLRGRSNSNILIILSLLLLPLPSPPISSRANSKLICNSHWRRNWCLILVLGNRIIQVMREWWRKIRQGEKWGWGGGRMIWRIALSCFCFHMENLKNHHKTFSMI